ncbi:hypothetical protein N0V85_001641 [Neurospora sp. IMI 360204]|nr:hypothetical protein N0V85_001641 [Neurospora sp. IMI 360204]
MAGETGASGSTAGPNSTGSTSWQAGSGSGFGSGPSTIPITGSGGTSSLIAPFNTGLTSGPGFRPITGPLNPFRSITGSASNPIGPSGTGPASGSGPGSGQIFLPIPGTAPASGSGAGSGQIFLPIPGTAPASGSGAGSGQNFLPISGTAPASGPGSFLPQTGSAGNPFAPASSAYSKSPAGLHQAFGSGIHMSNQDSRHSSASASHDETNFNALPTANRHTPMAIQSLTNPPYPTPPSFEVSGPSPAGLYSPTSPAGQLPLPNNFPGTSSHLSAGASQSPTPQSRSRHPSPLRPSPMSTEPSDADDFPYLTQALTNPKVGFLDSPSDSMSDLASQVFAAPDFELFDHYIDTTYGTLTRGVHEHMWKIEVPKLAFRHPFLMHNLLSTAAFNLAYTEQDEEKRKKWVTDGSRHFNLAVTGMREVLRNEGVTPENCHAVFASSSLLFIGDLADKGPFFNPADDIAQGVNKCPLIDELLGVFRVVKGIGSIVGAQEALLQEGPVGGLFNAEPSGEDHPNMERLLVQLRVFYQRVASVASRPPGLFLPPTKLEDTPRPSNLPKENQTILSEITGMEASIQFGLTKSKTPEQSIIAVWPINMTDDFLRLLQKSNVPPQQQQQQHAPQPSTSASSSSTLPPPGERNPIALALLGYYCCVMKETERECWFTTGWAEAVIKEVVAELEEMAGVTTSTSGNGSGSTALVVQGGHHDQGQTGVDRPVWREWARREWLEDAEWARKWIMTKEEELPKPTTFSEDPIADMDATLRSTQGQRPGADAPKVTKGRVGSSQAGRNQWSRQWASMMETQGQQPGVPEPAPTTSLGHSDVPLTGTQGQQPGADAHVMESQGQQQDTPMTGTQGQQPGADAPVMDTRGQQSGVPEPAPITSSHSSDVPMTGTQGQQPGVPEAQAATGAS